MQRDEAISQLSLQEICAASHFLTSPRTHHFSYTLLFRVKTKSLPSLDRTVAFSLFPQLFFLSFFLCLPQVQFEYRPVCESDEKLIMRKRPKPTWKYAYMLCV
jgi:hypothetical protein